MMTTTTTMMRMLRHGPQVQQHQVHRRLVHSGMRPLVLATQRRPTFHNTSLLVSTVRRLASSNHHHHGSPRRGGGWQSQLPQQTQQQQRVAGHCSPQQQQYQKSTLSAPLPPPLATTTSPTTPAYPTTVATDVEIETVNKIANQVGVRLTKNELTMLRKKLDPDGNGRYLVTNNKAEIQRVGQDALQKKTVREVCLSVICSPENPLDKWGVRVIHFFDYLGTALFAVVGTQVAGDAGMNLVGCSLVGCVAAMGGGTLNTVIYGGASSLLGPTGVRWVAHPSYMLTALVASLLTFFAWPLYCRNQADHYLRDVIGQDQLNPDGTVSKEAFMRAWHSETCFQRTIRDALPRVKGVHPRDTADDLTRQEMQHDGEIFFNHIDMDSSGDIDMPELEKLVQRRFYNGWETYWLDTFALSSLSIAGVTGAVRLGLHPIVAASSGVTVCFGGLLRDLLCGRDLAIGSQSYAFATGSSSAMYIVLRELSIRRIMILPLVVRTFAAAGTCISLRAIEYWGGRPLLRPMHGRPPLPEKK